MKYLFIILTSLFSLSIHGTIVEIGSLTYEINSKIKTAEVSSKENGKYSGEIVIPSQINYLGDVYDVTAIKYDAFKSSYITSVSIPEGVKSIGSSAFSNCYNLESVIIPNSVVEMGMFAFGWCIGLKTVELGNGITSIPYHCFGKCSKLETIIFPKCLESIGESAFLECSELKEINIPENVTFIGMTAFANCKNVESLILPNSNIQLSMQAFQGIGVKTLIIPNGVKSIGRYCFNGCKNLTSIIIGGDIQQIEDYAFAYCPDIVDVFCYAKEVPITNLNTFEDSYIEYVTLHVLDTSIDLYKIHPVWKNFKYIVSLNNSDPKPTGINMLKTVSIEKGKKIFDIRGHQVQHLEKGLYILNGKKVVIR